VENTKAIEINYVDGEQQIIYYQFRKRIKDQQFYVFNKFSKEKRFICWEDIALTKETRP
jgi:hypothetical protein